MADNFIAAAAAMRENQKERQWRCFQCDELFTDEESALAHFGKVETYAPPACCDRDLSQINSLLLRLRRSELHAQELFRQKVALEKENARLRKLAGED